MENSEVATATYTYQKPQAKISFTENEYTVDLGKTVSVTATTEQTGTLTYSIEDGGTGSTIDSSTGLLTAGTTAGIAVVTASLAETDDYAATKATVNVYVEDPNKVEYTDVLNHDVFKLSNSYKDYKWTSTTTGITYDAYAYLIVNGTNKYMQFSKDKDDASGLITTDNPKGLKLKKVSIEWANSCNKKFDLFSKAEPYSSTKDLYDEAERGNLVTTLCSTTSSEYTAQDGTASNIGFHAQDGTVWAFTITITWEGSKSQATIATPTVRPEGGIFKETQQVTITAAEGEKIVYTLDGKEPTSDNVQASETNTVNVSIEKPATDGTVTLKVAATNGEGKFSEVKSYEYRFVTIQGDGTQEKAYTPADIANLKALNESPTNNEKIYIKGTIVGAVKSGGFIDNNTKTNIAIGNTANAEDGFIAVGINDGCLRNIVNIVDNKEVIGKEIIVYGAYNNNYFTVGGVQNVTEIIGLRSFIINNSEGFATYYNDCAFRMPEGFSGSTVTGTSDGSLTYGTTYEAGETVPTGTALLLTTDNQQGECPLNSLHSTAKAPTDNLLHGANAVDNDGKMNVNPSSDGGSMKYYILSHGKDGTENADKLGFYLASQDGEPISYQAPYAFLAVEIAAAEAAPMMFSLIRPTDINNISTSNSDTPQIIYTLSGLRIYGKPNKLPAGLYIVNGHKMFVK